MRDLPSCYGESGVQVAEAFSNSSKSGHNLVTCLYSSHLSGDSCVISITWSKNVMGHGLSIGVADSNNHPLCRMEMMPWIFSKRKGSKNSAAENTKVDVFWDLSNAKFGSGPEPIEGFYVALLFDLQIVLLLGDLIREAYRKTNAGPPPCKAMFLGKREHIYGKKVYCTKAQFCGIGQVHDIMIECRTLGLADPCLEIRVDKKRVLLVKRLLWKFRGNQRILVDGLPVEVFWDVHNWLFDASLGNAVFMFQAYISPETSLQRRHSQALLEHQGHGFSLVLYAWKSE